MIADTHPKLKKLNSQTMTTLTISQLEHILKLSKKKDSIAADLEKIDRQMAAVVDGAAVGNVIRADASTRPLAAKTRKPRAKKTASKAGGLKEQILAVLGAAGADG